MADIPVLAAEADTPAPEVADSAAPAAEQVFEVVAADPGCNYGGMTRPAVGYNGYTYFHLPESNEMPEPDSAVDAMPAIFAARIARSSFVIRSRLR